jgi:hypothetical protein
MKAYRGVDVYVHTVLTFALVGGEWLASRPCRFTPGERTPGTHWIGGWVDPRASLDDVDKRKFLALAGFELRPLGRAARNQSLYRLSYPGSDWFMVMVNNRFLHKNNERVDDTVSPVYIIYCQMRNTTMIMKV